MARGKRARRTLRGKEYDRPKKLELSPPGKRWGMSNKREFTGWNNWRKTEEAPHEWDWCSKQTQAPGRRGWEGGKNTDNWKGKSMNNFKRKHRLKSLRRESKNFAWVGWILDYGLRFWEEEGRAGGKIKQLRIELEDEEARVDLTRNAPDEKRWEPTIGKPTAWT